MSCARIGKLQAHDVLALNGKEGFRHGQKPAVRQTSRRSARDHRIRQSVTADLNPPAAAATGTAQNVRTVPSEHSSSEAQPSGSQIPF